MAHFAEIDENNMVIRVFVVENEQEHRGQEFLANDLGLGGRWEKTSYNTHGGIHYNAETNEPSNDQLKAFRKNYAGIGYFYDEIRDAFIPPKPFESWVLNEETCLWEAPIPIPVSGGPWTWNEDNQQWEEIENNQEVNLNPPLND